MLEPSQFQAPEKGNLRDTLFGDYPLAVWARVSHESEPWQSFKTAKLHLDNGKREQAIELLQEITEMPDLESRQYLQAWLFLRELRVPIPETRTKEVLGVVVEVGMPKGLDLVAAWADHHARYYNFNGAGVVWETRTTEIDTLIGDLLHAAQVVANVIGPWEGSRPAPPAKGHARINILTPSGLHFGEGPFETFAKDRLAGPVFSAAARLMTQLIELTRKKT